MKCVRIYQIPFRKSTLSRMRYTLVGKEKRIYLILISFFLILFGLLIYLFFNKNTLITQLITIFVKIPQVNYEDGLLIKIVRNYGADFLWASSFTVIIQSILFLQKKMIWWLLLCALLGVTYEIAQYFGIVNGTPDIVDILVYLLGTLFGIIIIRRFCNEKMD